MKKIQKIIGLIAAGIIAYIFYTQTTLNFGYLGFTFLIVIIALPLLYQLRMNRKLQGRNNDHSLTLPDLDYSLYAALALLILGWMSIKTLNNYFNADKHVYKNIDHHAVRLDGITFTAADNFLLAANSRNAFFDNEEMQGEARITGVGENGVTLRLSDFSRPIFVNQLNDEGRCERRDLLNAESMLSFKDGETLSLRMNDGSVYEFSIQPVKNPTKDSIYDYKLVAPGNRETISDEHRFLKVGLSLTGLTRGAVEDGVDFSGIHIVRSTIYPIVKEKDKFETYKDVGYTLEVQNVEHETGDRYVTAVKTSGSEWRSLDKVASAQTIEIPVRRTFFIGYDEAGTTPCYFDRDKKTGQLQLLFKLPMYHYLAQTPEKDFNNVYVTTSLADFEDDNAIVPENIMLFDVFTHSDNSFRMKPMNLSFVSGATNQQLAVLCSAQGEPMAKVLAGENFKNRGAISTNKVEWVIGLEDLKQTSPFQVSSIKRNMMIFVLALALLLFVGMRNMGDDLSARRNTFTMVEFTAYAVTIYLTAFRWFLLWRASVFPPVENITYFEFHGIFRNSSNNTLLLFTMIAFVIVVAVAKVLLNRWHSLVLKDVSKKFLWGLVGLSLVVTIAVALAAKSSPWLCITIPVLAYLLSSVCISKIFAACYLKKDWADPNALHNDFGIRDPQILLFLTSLCNAFVYSLILLYIDGGYGILFFTFILFWTMWMLHDHVTTYLADAGAHRLWRYAAVLMLFFCLVGLIWQYKEAMEFMFVVPDQESSSFLGLASEQWQVAMRLTLVGILVTATVMWVLAWRSKIQLMVTSLVVGVLFGLVGFAGSWYVQGHAQHIAQRVAVHFSKAEDVMRNIKDDGTEQRFLNAALNHAIIGEYSSRGDEVELTGDHGYGYFKMQPHSKVGALWNAQLTDISLVRYVIAEHSPMLPFLLVTFFLIMLIWASCQPYEHRWARALLIQIPLLLMLQSLLIWMANTQRFIFLGQDFPMVSINSRLTIVFYFSLLIIWVTVAVYEKTNFIDFCENTYDLDASKSWRYIIARRDTYKLGPIMALCLLFGYLAPVVNESKEFKLEELMGEFAGIINNINKNQLKEFQNGEPSELPLKDLPGKMAKFNAEYYIDTLLAGFPFGQRLWKDFLQDGCYHNNSSLVLHAKLNREKQIELKTINKFYNRSLPVPVDREWRGSIVSTSDTLGVARWQVHAGTLHAYKLPAEWMANNHDVTIVSGKDSTYSRENQSTFSMKGIRMAAVLSPDVAVGHSSFDSLKYVMPHHRYMARNTMINGHRRFFYPLGSKMFWMKNFAEEVKRQREWHPKNMPAKRIKPVDHSNVEVTLLPDLTRKVYDALAAAEDPAKVNKVNFNSVIVANGDGEVMAMADFNRLYAVNPNDNHQLRKLLDHFYIYGEMGSEKERDCFGSRNLVSIPFGPGSTQKPVLWTAVASHLDFDWGNLRIASYEINGRNRVAFKEKGEEKKKHYSIPIFNEEKFRPSKPLAPLISDEHGGAELSLHDYMQHSSNVYNALMAYVGSFREVDLQRAGVLSIAPSHDGSTLFSYFDRPLTDSLFVDRFPVMNLAGGRQFSFNMKPQPDDQPHSLLENAMHEMFFRNDSCNYRQYRVTPAVGVLKTDSAIYSGANGYAFIEKSRFESRQGEGMGREKGYEFMETAIRSTAIGGSRVWFVTPWKMAESYARMASLNQNLHLSLLRRPVASYNQFPNLSEGYKNARRELFDGMSDVLIDEGTLASQKGLLGITTGAEGSSNMVGPYFIYAKTGTMGTSPAFDYNTGEARMVKRGKKMSQIETDQRRLGVIITNRDLMTTSVNELADVRYVVLYFTSSLLTSKTYADVIKAVIGSAEFRQYMNK